MIYSKLSDYLFGLKFYCKSKIKGGYKSILESDEKVHNIIIPIATYSPRILCGSATTTMKTIECNSYDEYCNGKVVELINAASYHYGGYGTLEYNAIDVLNNIVDRFELLCDGDNDTVLDEVVRSEFARYMGYEHCTLTSTGYGMNMLVFQEMKDHVFVMDEECHNSMFMGAKSTGNGYIKFKHNDVDDLDRILRSILPSSTNILVCVESLYSMSGNICPLNLLVDLKHKYGFKLYVDEAHSLFTLGRTGRGILEHCNVNPIDVDILGFTLSKSMGGIGGAIVSHRHIECNERVPMVIKARLLQVIRKTNLMENRMTNLKIISEYLYDMLIDSGLKLKNIRGSPIISFHIGTYRNLSMFVNTAQKEGLAITGAGPPATKEGEAVVRICLCANHTEEQVRFIVDKILELSHKDKIMHKPLNLIVNDNREESNEVDNNIMQLIGHDFPSKYNTCISKYGLGACSARWLYGTFDIHLKTEKRIGEKYATYGMDCMIYSDTNSVIDFTIEALIEPLKNKKLIHHVLLPYEMNKVINMSKYDKNRIVNVYEVHNIPSIKSKKHYITIYVEEQDYIEDILSQLKNCNKCKGITLIMKDKTYGNGIDLKNYHDIDKVVILGTFNDLNIQGGYCVSDKNTINVLRWRSRGYFFTAAPMPITMQRLSDKLDNM